MIHFNNEFRVKVTKWFFTVPRMDILANQVFMYQFMLAID